MRRPLLFIAALPLLLLALLPGSAQAGVFPYEVHRLQLDNGLKVLLVPMPSEGLVAYWSIVRTGSRDEVEEGVTGFAHFFEHMMFRGSEKYPGDVYDSIVTSMGADANAYTSDDLTAYHLGFTREDLPTVIEIEADRFQNLQYSEADFKTESGAVYGEYRKGRTNPFWALFEGLHFEAFDQHTYKHMTIGYEADIKKMPEQFEYSKSFFQRFYRPENVVLLVAGDFDRDVAEKHIRANYEGWKPGYQAPAIPKEPAQTAPKRTTIPFDGQTLPILSVSFKGERFLPSDRTMLAATLIGELGFGQTSPLYKKLVLDEQRVEVLFEDFGYNRDPGLWSIIARVKDPADLGAVEAEILDTLESMQRTPPTEEQLAAVRSRSKYSFLSGLTTPGAVAGGMARFIAITGDLTCVDEMYATLDQVTPKDVQVAAQKYLTADRRTVAVLHSKDQALPEVIAEAPGASEAVLLPVAADPNLAFKFWFRAGSQDDPPGKEGLASLTAAMVGDGGTAHRSYDEILESLFPMAAWYGASVDKEMTVVTGSVHRDHAEGFYDLMSDALLHPGFRQEDFERLRDQTVSGIENSLRFSSDEELGKATLSEAVFAGTPYEHLVEGTVASLKALTLDDVREFHRQHYTKDNVVLGLGGSFTDSLLARVQADLQRLPKGTASAVAAPEPAPIEGRHVVLVKKPGPSTAISFGVPIDVHRGSREFYALWLANSWLGEHRNSSSHLYQVIREARGMNYGDYSYIEVFPNGGRRSFPPTGVGRRQHLFEVWIRPVPQEQALFATRAALREIDLLIENGMTQEQFETTRGFLQKYALHYAETTMDRLGYAVDDRFYGIEEGHLRRLQKTLGELTLDEVNAAIRKHLQTDHLIFAMVTEDAEGIRDALVADQVSPIDYGEVAKPAEILEEDQVIESYPLGIEASRVRIRPVEEMFETTTERAAEAE